MRPAEKHRPIDFGADLLRMDEQPAQHAAQRGQQQRGLPGPTTADEAMLPEFSGSQKMILNQAAGNYRVLEDIRAWDLLVSKKSAMDFC